MKMPFQKSALQIKAIMLYAAMQLTKSYIGKIERASILLNAKLH